MMTKLIRIITRNKVDFFINLVGLSVAMTVFIFISLYVKSELTYDCFHSDADRIFRLSASLISPNGKSTDMALANPSFAIILKDRCPEIEEITYIEVEGDRDIEFTNTVYGDINVRMATPAIFNMFSYPAIYGDPSDFLKSPNSIVLTESLSRKIFGDLVPIGQKISIGESNYDVTGVIEDLPRNTDMQFAALIPSDIDGTEELFDWGEYYVYIKTQDAHISSLTNKLAQITEKEYKDLLKEMGGFQLVHQLQALKSIHFDNSKLADSPKGNKTMVYVFSVIALLILIIAGINYNNLNLAQIEKREKEFTIRKTIGCSNPRIMLKIIGESLLSTLLALVLSVALSVIAFPLFNNLFDTAFQISSILYLALPFIGIFTILGILSALYPALKIIGKNRIGKQTFNLFGKSLVTFQYIVSIAMIAGLILVFNQIHFMKNAELGFDKEQLLVIPVPSASKTLQSKKVIRQHLSSLPEIKSLAFGGVGTMLGDAQWMKSIMADKDKDGNDIQFILNLPEIDENYINLFGIELLQGRNFSSQISTDKDKAVIINESYAKVMGWEHPVGRTIGENESLSIIGVIKDFNFTSLNNPIEPLCFSMLQGQPAYCFIKATLADIPVIRKEWKTLFPHEGFEFKFMDEHMAGLYQQQEKDMTIFSYLTLIAILISFLGLYGLTSHFCLNRTKEIGIRKVNGAKISEVMVLLNKDFVKMVFIAFLIATPIAYYAMSKWLENFAYKTTLSWWIFVAAGILALGIALLTVSWRSWKATTRNPVEALRYE